MNFPSLKTARVLNEEEMLSFRGGACNSGCKSGCSSSCKTGCSPGNKNNNSGNGNTVEVGLQPTNP
ncbi:hypothetical protein JSO59_002955 [Riemerella anatipestifer]|uniref:hypothetical protein n=1 Tax=Riemerella anatipestifer TaxID=34085 RepID=UPI0030C5BCB6